MVAPPLTSVFCEKNTKGLYMKYYIANQEHLAIAQDIGDSAVLLYMYYLRMATTEHPVITDIGAAKSLGWTERKARRYRGELTKHGWYKQVKFTRPDGTRMITYHIGREAVARLSQKKALA